MKKQNSNLQLGYKHKIRKYVDNGTFFFIACISLLILQLETQICCLDTLLQVCIPWMYYEHVVLGVSLLPFIVNPIIRLVRKPSKKKKPISESYIWKIAIVLIIVPTIIFLPNRFIPIGPKVELRGGVIDQIAVPVNKSPSSDRNYVKIRLDEENISFWYYLNKESKPLGTKCIVSTRKGLFGMRYVEDVGFLVE